MRKFLLWDHDGVLVDTERWYFLATQEGLRMLDVDFDRSTYLRLMADGRTYWDLARAQGVPEDRIKVARQHRDASYQRHLCQQPIEIEGVMDVLSQLSQDYKMAIVTTSRREDFQLIHRSRQIIPFFDFVINLEDCTRAKPHPEPYLKALERFGAAPEDAIAIEDSSRGLKAARAAGLDCIVVRSEFTAEQDFTGAWQMIDSVTQLPDALRRSRSLA